MKKVMLLLGLMLAFAFVSNAQLTTADVFKTKQITWYGLDFSNIQLIGAIGFTDPDAIKNRYFNSWNNLVIGEPDKYDLKKFFYKDSVEYNLDIVTERNKLPDAKDLVTNQSYSFTEEKVSEILSNYTSGDKEGIGLVFIMESFNKIEEKGYMWVSFFDISNGNVLLTKHINAKASGFGLRNYWAGSYYKAMKNIGKKEWEIWKEEQ